MRKEIGRGRMWLTCVMVHDVILYIDFRLLVLLICWFCKEMLGRTTAERKLGFPSVMLEVLSFGNILVQRKNELRVQCQLLSYNSWKEIYLKIKVGVFFFFFCPLLLSFGWPQMELESSGKWAQQLRSSLLGVTLYLCFYFLPNIQFVREISTFIQKISHGCCLGDRDRGLPACKAQM